MLQADNKRFFVSDLHPDEHNSVCSKISVCRGRIRIRSAWSRSFMEVE